MTIWRLLEAREESWSIKGRSIWLHEGGNNTKLFQQYAKGRKDINNTLFLIDDVCNRV